MKHTKGKWSNTGLDIRAQNSLIIATVYEHLPINQSKEEAEANAKLISCAPEMIKLLSEIEDLASTPDYIIEAIQLLIKKATT